MPTLKLGSFLAKFSKKRRLKKPEISTASTSPDYKNDKLQKRDGHIKTTFKNGDSYEGNYLDGEIHGKGVYTYASGAVYDGEWNMGKKDGRGLFTENDKSKYDGCWHDDKRHGHGELFYEAGGRYVGDWSEDKRHGHGELFYDGGGRYVGDWSEDKRHGHGELFYDAGDRYVGDWSADLRHGHGEHFYTGGGHYVGNWYENWRHGLGEYFFPEGHHYAGSWLKDQMQPGCGQFFYTDNGKRRDEKSKSKVIEVVLYVHIQHFNAGTSMRCLIEDISVQDKEKGDGRGCGKTDDRTKFRCSLSADITTSYM